MDVTILIIYTDGTEKVYKFDTWDDANKFVQNEGDHVLKVITQSA